MNPTKLLTVLTLATALSFAQSKPQPKPAPALQGYDPVAYFELNQPTPGSPTVRHEHNGVTFQFRSAESKALFLANPTKYLPQFGGYCAWAVGHNYTAPADPTAWKIIDGKLYLNYNASVQKKWDAERDQLIPAAEKNWPGLSHP